jgi:hypothetical protein
MGQTYGYIRGKFGQNCVFAGSNPRGQTEASVRIGILNPNFRGPDGERGDTFVGAKWFADRGDGTTDDGRKLHSVSDLLDAVQQQYDRGELDNHLGDSP